MKICYFSFTVRKWPPWLYFINLQLGIWMSFKTSNLSLTIAKILKPEVKLMATKSPLGCIAIEIGSSVKVWEIKPFFSYPYISKKFHNLTVLSSEHDPSICLVTEQDKEFIFLLWKPEAKKRSSEEISASPLDVLM